MPAPLRHPRDVKLLDWASREDFGRVRAEWLQLHRWDTSLSPATMTVLAEIAARMASDKNFAWPSIQRLAAELGWSVATVKRSIAQAIERGWLICEKRGFGGSNHYAMGASPAVTSQVLEEHDERVALMVEGRDIALSSKMSPMAKPSIELKTEPSLSSELSSHSAQKRALNELKNEPLTLSKNLNTEPDHRTSSQGPSDETVQDKSLGASNDVRAQILARAAKRGVDRPLLDRDGIINGETQARELLIEVFGDGDHQLGLKRVATAGQRVRWLIDEIDTEGAEAMVDGVISTLEFVLRTERDQSQKAKVAS
ncbi:hypothetical protein GGC47_001066 [Bosea sp. OAE752]|uniref:helix-turn-helix domain-containing protein n=1 Tax=Bosea sp. OAE752 TaxID=2663873 RepID=UPI003D1D194C